MKIITSGAAYIDIDAYACMVAYAELLDKIGEQALPVSTAEFNSSISKSVLAWEGRIERNYEPNLQDSFILVDVSDPAHFDTFVPAEPHRLAEIVDHHPGFEEYWRNLIGERAEIRPIGAAATQIYAKFKRSEVKPSALSARLLLTAILDNTLNFTAQITTQDDIDTYKELFLISGLAAEWPETYFSECQTSFIDGLPSSLDLDAKIVRFADFEHDVRIAQIVAWRVESFNKLRPKMYAALGSNNNEFGFINLIDVHKNQSHFLCQNPQLRSWLERLFGIGFDGDQAIVNPAHLRKEILQKALDTSSTQ